MFLWNLKITLRKETKTVLLKMFGDYNLVHKHNLNDNTMYLAWANDQSLH